MDPNLDFAFRQRYRLSGAPVFENPFAPWSIEDLYPELLLEDDWEPAGFEELSSEPDAEEWILSLTDSIWPLLLLIERCCHEGELLPLQLRESRLDGFPLASVVACEQAIAAAPIGLEVDLFRVVSQAVRIERARRRGRP